MAKVKLVTKQIKIKDGKVVDYLTWSNIIGGKQNKKELDDVSVVIMAGGKGTRMEPFTSVLPKPLIPIHEKPIIEHIIEQFINVGCSNFYSLPNQHIQAYHSSLS